MGSMWCKPAEFREECSPKLNINSLLSRLRGQVCPSRCRYPQASNRPRTKLRPRNISVTNGARPVISPPLMQPIPPPRKKRRRVQEMSRSEEELSSNYVNVPPLRTANSLPVLCVPISQLRPNVEAEGLASIKEEVIFSPEKELEKEMESVPISEVYFLRKDGQAPNFEAVPKDVAEKANDFINGPKEHILANSNFLERNVKTPVETKIRTEITETVTEEKKEIHEKEIRTKVILGAEKKTQDASLIRQGLNGSATSKDLNENKQDRKESLEHHYETVEITPGVDEPDNVGLSNAKKWQDKVKSKWLQNILIGSDPAESQLYINTGIPSNTISTFVPNYLQNSEKKDHQTKSSQEIITVKSEEIEPKLETKLKTVLDNPSPKTEDQGSCQLIVTPENLSQTLQRLSSPKSSTRDAVFNNRNLVYSSQNVKESLGLSNEDTAEKSKGLEKNRQTENNKKDYLKPDLQTELHQHSRRSSRHSSITDSLQEFESSIYDMLQESAKGNASDDDDSFVAIHKQNVTSRQEATTASS